MNHKPWTITAKAKDEIEILLYEMIGQDFWTGEGTTAKSFAEDLKAAGEGIRKIHLRVNSPGGSVFDGLAIYNTLLSHGATVTARVDGIAASIASVIIMAASEISMGDNAMMMIHNPATMIAGDSNKMRKMAETMDKVKSSMIAAYRRHTPKSVEEVGALMDAETWMTADETVENGFAETVTTPEGDTADVAANFDLSHFRRVPQQIAAVFGRQHQPRAGAVDDASERRRRESILFRQHNELHEMTLAGSRAHTIQLHELQLRDMRAAEISEDEQRRRIMAQRTRELRAWRLAELAEAAIPESERRRRIMAERARELRAWRLAEPEELNLMVRIQL